MSASSPPVAINGTTGQAKKQRLKKGPRSVNIPKPYQTQCKASTQTPHTHISRPTQIQNQVPSSPSPQEPKLPEEPKRKGKDLMKSTSAATSGDPVGSFIAAPAQIQSPSLSRAQEVDPHPPPAQTSLMEINIHPLKPPNIRPDPHTTHVPINTTISEANGRHRSSSRSEKVVRHRSLSRDRSHVVTSSEEDCNSESH